jgi:hypothetical protein
MWLFHGSRPKDQSVLPQIFTQSNQIAPDGRVADFSLN